MFKSKWAKRILIGVSVLWAASVEARLHILLRTLSIVIVVLQSLVEQAVPHVPTALTGATWLLRR